MAYRFFLLAVLELAYMACVRWIPTLYGTAQLRISLSSAVECELYISLARTVSCVLMLVVFRRELSSKPTGDLVAKLLGSKPMSLWMPLVIGCLLFLAVPFLCGEYRLHSRIRDTFAMTSFAVGLREELVYRGLIQVLLTSRIGFFKSICLTNALFTVYHIGVTPPDWVNFLQIFLAGVFLSAVFQATGKVWIVFFLHSIYDIIFCYTPFYGPGLPLEFYWSPVLLSLPCLCALYPLIFLSRNQASPPSLQS